LHLVGLLYIKVSVYVKVYGIYRRQILEYDSNKSNFMNDEMKNRLH